MDVLMDGITFGESPRWRDGRVWFSDWAAGRVFSVAADGTWEVEAEVASFPMCIDFLPDGRLLIVSSADRKLLRREPDGSLMAHADLAAVSTKPWNDIVVDGRGNAYVNNIGFDFPGGEYAPGLIALVTPDGTVTQVADGLGFPNGMAVTEDNSTLIVAESYAEQLTAYDIAPDGTLTDRRVWAATPKDHPDGICLDAPAPCGTPTWAINTACASGRVATCSRPSTSTVGRSPAPSAMALTPPCSWWASTGAESTPLATGPVRSWHSPHPRAAPATRKSPPRRRASRSLPRRPTGPL